MKTKTTTTKTTALDKLREELLAAELYHDLTLDHPSSRCAADHAAANVARLEALLAAALAEVA